MSGSFKKTYKDAVKIGDLYLCYQSVSPEEIKEFLKKVKSSNDMHVNAYVWCRLQEGIIDLVAKNPDIDRVRKKIRKLDKIWKEFLEDKEADVELFKEQIWLVLNH